MPAGQSQKEVFVNEALARIDGLLHGAIEGTLSAPPATPADGQTWLVGTAPSGAWSGQAGKLALRQGGNWVFASPRDGMRLLDRSTGQHRHYLGGWHAPSAPTGPSGGTTVDSEARAAILAIVAALRDAGIFPTA